MPEILGRPFFILPPLFPPASIQAFQLLDPDPSLARPRRDSEASMRLSQENEEGDNAVSSECI
jgi:hypothetical protein